MLLHQSDKLLIGPLTPNIIAEFSISKTQMGAVLTGALIVGTVLYPVWGYLYDRFLVTRGSTGIDDSSYPGLFSLIADYFGPKMRGKIYGILQLAQPIGYLLGMILALMLASTIGWRSVFYITGGLGIILAIIIFFSVKEMPRGRAEPEFVDIEIMGQYRFSWEQVKEVFKKPSMWFIFVQGFAGVFPWNVITYWFFTYLAEERGYDEESILFTMAPIILILAGGYFVGGAAGDWLFKRTLNGRVIISSIGVLTGAIFLYFAIITPVESRIIFFILMSITALFMPLSAPNVTSTVYDITLPEVRSTALAVEYFIENSGAALAPLLAGIIADNSDLRTAILTICITAWILCFFIYLGALFFVPKDIKFLRKQLQERAALERGLPVTE
jgi:MFS family permease